MSAGGGFSFATVVGFGFLTVNSAVAIRRAEGDPLAMAMVAVAYLMLVALFFSLGQLESAPANTPKRTLCKVAVWLETLVLTLLFSYKVAAVMPPFVQVIVWGMAAATVVAGLFMFFFYRPDAARPSVRH